MGRYKRRLRKGKKKEETIKCPVCGDGPLGLESCDEPGWFICRRCYVFVK